MFALPSIISFPVVSGLNLSAFDVPTAAAFIAWFLIAALVGSALGILREHGRATPTHAANDAGHVHLVLHPSDANHREAA
jgi:hypothetical protein